MDSPPLDPRRWRGLFVLLLGQFCALLDVSVTNVALPSIGRATGAGPAELQWVVSGYILAFALMPVIAGRLGDTRGRRRIFFIGVTGFIIASAAVGLSPVPLVIIAARVIQGMFGGLLGPQVSGYIQNAFPKSERGRAFGGLGITVGVGTALGPVIGGLLIGLGGPDFGWRLVFFINVPIGLAAIILAKLWVADLKPVESPASLKLDLGGAALLGAALLCILFPIVEINEFHSGWLFLLFIPGGLLLWAFLRRERRLTRRGRLPAAQYGAVPGAHLHDRRVLRARLLLQQHRHPTAHVALLPGRPRLHGARIRRSASRRSRSEQCSAPPSPGGWCRGSGGRSSSVQ